MSINSLSSNIQILSELGPALAPYIPGGTSGVLSITSTDPNLLISPTSGIVSANLSNDITVNNNLNVINLIELNGSLGEPGQVLTSQGESPPQWTSSIVGITSLTGDSNITCTVSGTSGLVELNPIISVTGLSVTNFINPFTDNQPANDGQVLSSTTGGTLSWITPSAPSTSGLIKNIAVNSFIGTYPATATSNSQVIYDNGATAVFSYTVGKTSVYKFDVSVDIQALVSTYFSLSLLVDNQPATPAYYNCELTFSGVQNLGVVFTYLNTNTAQNVVLTVGKGIQPEGTTPAPSDIVITNYFYSYSSVSITEIQ